MATQFLYDGDNVIQELSDGVSPSVNAAVLTGLGVDEVFGRIKGTTKTDYLNDRLGSTVALSDANANILTNYSYEPYGKRMQSGVPDDNSRSFTGREDDGTGLLYYRARLYDPEFGKFISEDPVGLSGGDSNLYRYVLNDPINSSDPFGLYRCVYSIRSATLYCSPSTPGNPSFGPARFVSGNNGPACSDCRNNPARTGVANHGPIPPGIYSIGPHRRRNAQDHHGRRDLRPHPDPRFAFQLHYCGMNPDACSLGCVAGPTFDELNQMLSLEDGDNVLTVFDDFPDGP